MEDLVYFHHHGNRIAPENADDECDGRWTVSSVKIVWDMPAGHELTAVLDEDEDDKSSGEMQNAMEWRKARDFFVVNYHWDNEGEGLYDEEADENGEISMVPYEPEKAALVKKDEKEEVSLTRIE